MNSEVLYIIWKSVLSLNHLVPIFGWNVFTLGWTGGIVCESAKIELRQSIKVREWIEMYEMRCIADAFFQ